MWSLAHHSDSGTVRNSKPKPNISHVHSTPPRSRSRSPQWRSPSSPQSPCALTAADVIDRPAPPMVLSHISSGATQESTGEHETKISEYLDEAEYLDWEAVNDLLQTCDDEKEWWHDSNAGFPVLEAGSTDGHFPSSNLASEEYLYTTSYEDQQANISSGLPASNVIPPTMCLPNASNCFENLNYLNCSGAPRANENETLQGNNGGYSIAEVDQNMEHASDGNLSLATADESSEDLTDNLSLIEGNQNSGLTNDNHFMSGANAQARVLAEFRQMRQGVQGCIDTFLAAAEAKIKELSTLRALDPLLKSIPLTAPSCGQTHTSEAAAWDAWQNSQALRDLIVPLPVELANVGQTVEQKLNLPCESENHEHEIKEGDFPITDLEHEHEIKEGDFPITDFEHEIKEKDLPITKELPITSLSESPVQQEQQQQQHEPREYIELPWLADAIFALDAELDEKMAASLASGEHGIAQNESPQMRKRPAPSPIEGERDPKRVAGGLFDYVHLMRDEHNSAMNLDPFDIYEATMCNDVDMGSNVSPVRNQMDINSLSLYDYDDDKMCDDEPAMIGNLNMMPTDRDFDADMGIASQSLNDIFEGSEDDLTLFPMMDI